jgi:exonuclease SbcC
VAQLLAGQPCPICRQPVIEPPERHDDHHLVHAAAEARADRCQAALSEVLAGAARADGRVQALEADLSHRRKEAGDLAGTVEGVAATEVLSAAAGLALAAADRAKQAATMLRAAEAAVTEAAAALDRLERAEQRFRRGFVEQWESAAGQGPPAPGGRSLADDWRGLSRWAAARSEALAADRDRAGAAGERLASTRAELIAGLAAAAEPLGVDPAPDQLAASVAAARATAEAEVTRLDEQLAHQRELATTVASLRQRQAVHASLGQHLAANGFERWLLAEALEAIVERATTRLEELTSGRYSLEVLDGSFHVRDHGNADERRDVRTLSGGEIFLASLALALALSESIAELAPLDAPQLDSIFLDEGFGSLDTETLDVVATAIEELSATGRLVVIVTHVRDLADRMPVRFEVSKGPATSTVERVES